MWKIAFCLGMVLSIEVNASSCNLKSIDEVALFFKNSPEEKSYQEINQRLIEKTRTKGQLRNRPELSVSFDADKSEFNNNELSVSLLFSLDEYRKYGLQKDQSESEALLKKLETKNSSVERLIESSLSYFKVSQNAYFNRKIDSLLATVKSSEEAYNKRPIRSRDDEIVLNSLRLIRDNLVLKKVMLEDQVDADNVKMSSFGTPKCVLNYEEMGKLLAGISVENVGTFDESNSLKLQELKLKEQFVFKMADFESKSRFTNLKIGPVFSREVIAGDTEHRFGLELSMDIPSFDNSANVEFTEVVKKAGSHDVGRAKVNVVNQHKYYVLRLRKYTEILKQINSTQKVENDIMKMKKSFDMGIISPLVYLDSYRSYVDYLETSQEAQLRVFETYLKIRGAYVENTIF